MRLTRRQEESLYIAVAAAVHGELMRGKGYRNNPRLAALTAKGHALAAVHESRIGQRDRKK